jgi:ribosomal protein S12 methylthiotransferase accessory factor YcaO
VAVHRHRHHAEPLRDRVHGHGLKTALVGELQGGLVTGIPAVAATLATLIRPAAWRHFAAGATSAYSLSPAAWQALLEAAQQPEFTQAGCAIIR